MSASNHINPHQLKMFMSPSEIDFYTGVDVSSGDTFESLMKGKLSEAQRSGLYDDIEKHGVKTPIQVIHDPQKGRSILGHGHHRYASALNLEQTTKPDILIPVVHTDATYFTDKQGAKTVDEFAAVWEYEEYMDKNIGYGVGWLD